MYIIGLSGRASVACPDFFVLPTAWMTQWYFSVLAGAARHFPTSWWKIFQKIFVFQMSENQDVMWDACEKSAKKWTKKFAGMKKVLTFASAIAKNNVLFQALCVECEKKCKKYFANRKTWHNFVIPFRPILGRRGENEDTTFGFKFFELLWKVNDNL